MNRRIAILGACALAVAAIMDASAAGRSDLVFEALAAGRAQYVPNELIVQYKNGSTENDFRMVRGRLAAAKGDLLRNGAARLEIVRFTKKVGMADAIRLLEADPAVEFAEPNWIYTHDAASNDTYYTNGSLWGMYGDGTAPANAFGSQAGEAWANGKTDCSEVFVGIIDEGYMYAHADLAANAGKNPGEIEGNNIDDDGNGYIDDVYGWDFAGKNNSVFDGVADDHGTHVAGTIGGVGGNGTGVAGVCWKVKLLSAKFLGVIGGTAANAIRAVDYFTDLKTRHGINLVATSNSWGGGGFSQALLNAIERAKAADILFIAAAGNDAFNCDSNSRCFPAEYASSNIISVASLDSNGVMSSFSNYGATTVDIGAPGRGIWSAIPKRQGLFGNKVISSYASYSGTSMATPHVSGAAALYKAYHPAATAVEIKAAILGSAVPTPSLQGKVLSNGRLDVSGF